MAEMRPVSRKPPSSTNKNRPVSTTGTPGLALPRKVRRMRHTATRLRRRRRTMHRTLFVVLASITVLAVVCVVAGRIRGEPAGGDDGYGDGGRVRGRKWMDSRPNLGKLKRSSVMGQFPQKRYQSSIGDGNGYYPEKRNPLMPKTEKEKETLILEGKVQLVQLTIHKKKLQKASYGGIVAHFCFLDWEEYRKDPSAYPMFRDLVNRSCDDGSTFTYDLHRIVELATAYDDASGSDSGVTVRAVEPSGFVFHESRCGSTLVANALTAMSPGGHVVYSESQPPLQAIKACGIGGRECPPHRAVEIFQDVVYIMGRTRDPDRKGLFFKIQSMGTKYMDIAIAAFPNTPWMFVYRDPVQVMMSQFKMGVNSAICVRQLVDVPDENMQFLTSIERKIRNLNPYEKCAFHLSTLCDTAIKAIGNSGGMGIGVNYKGLTDKLIDTVLPDHFKLEMTNESRERIIEVSGHYSKGRGPKKGMEWKEDSVEKDELATPKLKEACETFLYKAYNTLEETL